LLNVFAGHAAIAITNARLHREAEERARRLAVSAERERVVRDVHDTVARALGTILRQMDALGAGDPEGRVEAARAAARSALAETRRTVLGLGPALLDLHALDEAIAEELAWVRSTAPVRTDLVVTGRRRQPAKDLGAGALRLVQEALTNAVTHANAGQIR